MENTYFRSPSRVPNHLRFLEVKQWDRTIILCASPQEFSCLELHADGNGSTLCEGELLCPLCHPIRHPKRLYSYAPALFLSGDSKWEKVILPVGDHNGMVAERDLRGFRLTLFRKKRKDGTWSTLCMKDAVKVDPVILSTIGAGWFDIRPRLLKRYGISLEGSQAAAPNQEGAPCVDGIDEDGAVLSFADAQAKYNSGKAG